jgi:hypothetical protein
VETVVDTYGTTNGILNPSFETAGAGSPDIFASWSETSGTGAIEDGTGAGEFHGGAHAAKLTAGATANTNVNQTVNVIPGRSYTVSMWARGDGTYAGRYGIYDFTNSAFIVATKSTGVTATTYAQPAPEVFTAPAGCYRIIIYLNCPSTAGGVCYFDDVSLLPTDGLGALTIGANGLAFGPSFAGTAGDPGVWGQAVTRAYGVAMGIEITYNAANLTLYSGWSNGQSGAITQNGPYVNISGGLFAYSNGVAAGAIATYSAGVRYQYIVVARSAGLELYRRATSGRWLLMWVSTTGAVTPIYPGISDLSMTGTLHQMVVPQDLIKFPVTLFDDFTRSNGAIGSSLSVGPDGQGATAKAWDGATWAIATNAAKNTPGTTGSEILLNPGFETAGAGGADIWANWTESAVSATFEDATGAGEFHSGAHAAKFTATGAGSTAAANQAFVVVPGRTYTLNVWCRGDGTNQGKIGVYDATNSAYIVPIASYGTTSTTYALVPITFTVPPGCTLARVYLFCSVINGGICYYDDVSVLAVPDGDVFATQDIGLASVFIMGIPVYSATHQAGIVANLDSASSPANYLRLYFDGLGNIKLDKTVAGTVSNLISVAKAYSAGAYLNMSVDTSTGSAVVRCYYNDALLGTEQTVADAAIVAATRHGMYANDNSSSFTRFTVRPRGVGGQYSQLGRYF